MKNMCISLGLLTFLISGCSAHAHTSPPPASAKAAPVNSHYVWVDGHCSSGKWVKGYWSPRHGPHPHARQAEYSWVPAHWSRKGPHKRWVPGHWEKKRR